MLQNGLGILLDRELQGMSRFFDLFAGSGSIAAHVAQNFKVRVKAFDLQSYSVVVTGAIIERSQPLKWSEIWDNWHGKASRFVKEVDVPVAKTMSSQAVQRQRHWCAKQSGMPITRAYGGHYFSAYQAVWLDAFRSKLPSSNPERRAALAALIHAASQCVASPGHTAQPFQPTPSALPFLQDAWNRDVVLRTRENLADISKYHARMSGVARQDNANVAATKLREDDLAFIDPPYSGVHYSRFYHVLETIAEGECGEVFGVGRYPEPKFRPRSQYSLKTESGKALDELLSIVASRGSKAVLTFPDHKCSNGLSGLKVREIAGRYFTIKEQAVTTKFSTLGGHKHTSTRSTGRIARHNANELILVLRP